MTYGFGSGTPDPLVLNDGTFEGKLTVNGGVKLSIQNKVDGGSGQGLFLFDTDNTSWGIYMASAGALKSLSDGTSSAALDGRTGNHIRIRAGNAATNGFLWENNLEAVLMSLTADTGALYTAGVVNAGGAVVVESYTVATAPSASGIGAGGHIFVTDETGGATGAYSDGTNWRRYSDRAIVS